MLRPRAVTKPEAQLTGSHPRSGLTAQGHRYGLSNVCLMLFALPSLCFWYTMFCDLGSFWACSVVYYHHKNILFTYIILTPLNPTFI